MRIFSHLISGILRAVKTWKWILVIWFGTFIVVALVALPFKAGISSLLGKSMITELLKDGIHADVLANTGTNLSLLISSLRSGIFLVLLFGFLMNVFFSGGLFSVLRKRETNGSVSDFFGSAASSFWSFLVISLLVYLMLFLTVIVVTGIPVMVSRGSDSEKAMISTLKIAGVIVALILPVILLVADYARAWRAASVKKNAFTAIGYGFKHTFRQFFLSYAVMAIVLIVQSLFTWLVFSVASGMKPATGGGIFLMFILLQVMFILKICLRTWRYGSVTSMFEK